jgi:hypothetical protein
MVSPPPEGPRRPVTPEPRADRAPVPRLPCETKPAWKTTEFYAYLATVIGVAVASQLIGTGDGHSDYFRADRAWWYIVLLTIGYMLSRGLAKAGSPHPDDDRRR